MSSNRTALSWPNAAPDRVAPGVLQSLIRSDGGFTLCGKTGEHVRTGMAVAAKASISLEFPHDQWSDRRVSDWLAMVATRRWSLFCDLGGWLDERGIVHLDVVLVVPQLLVGVARVLGRLTGQHSMFDLDRLTVVAL
jgi:hypothetical protein